MTTTIEHIRKHLLSQFHDLEPVGHITLADVYANRKQFDEFVAIMNRNMHQGYFRYGRNEPGEPGRINYVDDILSRLERYLETGNKEYLVDVANSARLEFLFPSAHDETFFAHTDDGRHAEFL
jgi:hypothetical protein